MNYQQKIHKLTSLLLIAAITLTAVSSASCQKMTTTTMQLMKTEGTARGKLLSLHIRLLTRKPGVESRHIFLDGRWPS